MKKLIPLFFGIFVHFQGMAQVPIYTYNSTSDSICDGSAYLADSSYTGQYWYGMGIYQTGGNSINNLCPGNYTVNLVNTLGDTVVYTFVIGSNGIDTCNGLYAIVQSQTNASSANVCDGSVTVVAVGGVAPYSYTNSNGIPSGGFISNLCPGGYYFTVTDANGCVSTTPLVYIYSDSTTNPNVGPGIYVNPSDASAAGLCDGGFTLSVSDSTWFGIVQVFDYNGTQVASGVGPYTYSDSLCSGYYSINFSDTNGNVTYTYTFLVGDGSNIYVDSTSYYNNGNPNGADSIYSPVTPVCTIVYSQIDSANVGGLNYIGTDSVAVDWIVYSNGVSTSVLTYYQFDAAGNYIVVLQMYCDSTRAVEVFKAYAWLNLNPNGPVGISAIAAANVLVYPNPASETISLDAGNQVVNEVRLFDILGNKVLEINPSKTGDIRLESLTNGIYFLECTTNLGVFSKKIVKQ